MARADPWLLRRFNDLPQIHHRLAPAGAGHQPIQSWWRGAQPKKGLACLEQDRNTDGQGRRDDQGRGGSWQDHLSDNAPVRSAPRRQNSDISRLSSFI
jgi:hypothetical protein